MHRFFVTPEEIQANDVQFSPSISRQIARVLRLKPGERVIVLDNSGYEMATNLTEVNENQCTGTILSKEPCRNESGVKLLMILSLTQREKFEVMLQKCTEVGASAFLPIVTSRSLIQNPADVLSKYSRWRMILKESAEQSARGIIPELFEPVSFTDAIRTIPGGYPLCLIPWEDERNGKLREILQKHPAGKIAVMIGPEGGFSVKEVEQASAAGFKPVTLGKRILRMETAAVVAAALVLHEAERD